jgi:hypothetical protein
MANIGKIPDTKPAKNRKTGYVAEQPIKEEEVDTATSTFTDFFGPIFPDDDSGKFSGNTEEMMKHIKPHNWDFTFIKQCGNYKEEGHACQSCVLHSVMWAVMNSVLEPHHIRIGQNDIQHLFGLAHALITVYNQTDDVPESMTPPQMPN